MKLTREELNSYTLPQLIQFGSQFKKDLLVQELVNRIDQLRADNFSIRQFISSIYVEIGHKKNSWLIRDVEVLDKEVLKSD